MADLTISIDDDPSPDDRRAVAAAINAFHDRTVPHASQRFAVVARDPSGRLVAAVIGLVYWDWLLVEACWVDDGERGRGLGGLLLAGAERHAVELGCRNAWLDTFQALGFYRRAGYEVFGRLDDYPPGQTRWFLRKSLVPQVGELQLPDPI